MADLQRFVLRVLAGPNAGAEALLAERLVVGSAESDDIMIADQALAAGHFTIVASGGKFSVEVSDDALVIGGESRAKGTYALVPFQLIKFGTTACAVGPEKGEWPAFSAADLLPTPPAAPAAVAPEPAPAAAAAEPASAKAKDKLAGPGERPGAAPRPQARHRGTSGVMAVILVVLLAVAGGGYWLTAADKRDGTPAAANLVAAQAIVADIGARGVTVREEGDGTLLAEGFAPTSELQRRLRLALLGANLPIKYKVADLEQQVSAVRTIATAAGARLSVEPDTTNGKIVMSGYLDDMSVFDALRQVLKRDIADLRPIDARIVTPERLVSEVGERLAAAGLGGKVKIESSGGKIRLTGELPDEQRATVRRIAEQLNEEWSGKIKVEDATTAVGAPVPSAAAPSPAPVQGAAPVPIRAAPVTIRSSRLAEKFTVIVVGREAFVRDSQGRRYIAGDKLANGEVIEDIRVDELVTSKDGVKYRYTFGGG